MFTALSEEGAKSIAARFENDPCRIALDELMRLREVVKELAKAVDYPTDGAQNLLYRLKCEGIDTGLRFKPSSNDWAPKAANRRR